MKGKIDLKRDLLIFCLAGVLLTVASAYVLREQAVFVFLTACVFTVLFVFIISRRNRRIGKLADEVTHFLHGFTEISFASAEEGELSILEAEIGKMVQKLRTQTELLQKDKSFLADSIADISHQIRTPLTSLNLIATHLGTPGQPKERIRELLREMETLLIHVDWLVETLLKISKLDAGIVSMQSVCVLVAELIKQATELFLIPMELKHQQLLYHIPDGVSFLGDMLWMKEALMNVVKNCMEHIGEGGKIEITAEENAVYTEIRIFDNGPGIDEEDLPHLFERFYKGKNSSEKSVGIGLALARSIVNRQGGVITAHNKKSGGAEFVIRFYKSIL